MIEKDPECSLCTNDEIPSVWQDNYLRVIDSEDKNYPGLYRVIWKGHAREMTDLPSEDRAHLMRVVFAVEQAIRQEMKPFKINLASLGNQVPHLHWHIVPRFEDDLHYPEAIWAYTQKTPDLEKLAQRQVLTSQLAESVIASIEAVLKNKLNDRPN